MVEEKKQIEDYELYNNPEPKCPFCGHDNFVETEDYPQFDGDELEVECKNCEKEFKAIMKIEVTFESLRE